jgi:hypothetical protein
MKRIVSSIFQQVRYDSATSHRIVRFFRKGKFIKSIIDFWEMPLDENSGETGCCRGNHNHGGTPETVAATQGDVAEEY